MSTPDDPDFSYDTAPDLYLFTSLTAGSSHIITATSRLETILKANRVPFKAVDCATDEKARRVWSRRAQGKKLPGLVREGFVLADLDGVEEWNEYGEIKEHLGGPPLPTRHARFPEPSQNTVGGGNAATQPLPTRGKDGDGATLTAAQTLQNPQAGLLAAEAAKAAKARLNKATPAEAKAVAESETDAETIKNTQHNISPQADKKANPLDAEAMPTKPKSPEAEQANLEYGSPPTGHATIAHPAISVARSPESAATEVKDIPAKSLDDDSIPQADAINKELAANEAASTAAGPAASSGEAATHQPGAKKDDNDDEDEEDESKEEEEKSTEEAEAKADKPAPPPQKSEPKVSFAPDVTRESSNAAVAASRGSGAAKDASAAGESVQD